ncbi:glycosyltransferase family 4 protein [Trinickia dinghuensis]|uniref:Glycosyltransferase n=1 Tax=Trinickia dinghuensis TaxID=2291023 RepID=A0A3D8JTU7_9BURK|nr:glycosyltransferase family 4 protein [Trinickia dinghuensis]RDU95994.1 glycosyltransferase [Trinickia dinghuensis]
MRILQLVLAPRLSGAEMLVKGIAIGHRRGGHTVGIASLLPAEDDFADAARELAAQQVACLFPSKRNDRFARLVFLYRTIRHFAPDIVFAHTTIPALYVRALPLSVPIVFVMHSGMNDFTENRRLWWAERLLARRARALIGVTQRNVDQYAATIGSHGESFVVPNGVDVERFRIGRTRNDAENVAYADDAEDFENAEARRMKRIVQIGRYMPEKGQLDTVRAFYEVLNVTEALKLNRGPSERSQPQQRPQRRPEPFLHLCGVIEDRGYHARVVSLVETLGIAANVRIEGPRTDVPDLLAQADVFAMPSRFEAHSIGFLEALASGIPIVANAIGGFAFARGYPSVCLVDTEDAGRFGRALADALEQPRCARPLDGLTLEETAGRYLEIARRVVTGCGRANAPRREAASRR